MVSPHLLKVSQCWFLLTCSIYLDRFLTQSFDSALCVLTWLVMTLTWFDFLRDQSGTVTASNLLLVWLDIHWRSFCFFKRPSKDADLLLGIVDGPHLVKFKGSPQCFHLSVMSDHSFHVDCFSHLQGAIRLEMSLCTFVQCMAQFPVCFHMSRFQSASTCHGSSFRNVTVCRLHEEFWGVSIWYS